MATPEQTADPDALENKRLRGLSTTVDATNEATFSLKNSGPVLRIGTAEPLPENPKSYQDFMRIFQSNIDALDILAKRAARGQTTALSPADIDRTREILISKALTVIANFSARLSDYSRYDTKLMSKDLIASLEAGINQLGRHTRTQEEYFNLAQKTNLTPEERVICRDYATFAERAWRDIGLQMVKGTNQANPLVASTATIPAGVDHMYAVLQDRVSGEMYIVTTESVGGKGIVFTGKNEKELREKYQTYLVGKGNAGNSFGGAIYKDGKFYGIVQQTAWEKLHQDITMGGNTPTRLMNMPMFSSVDSTRGSAGSIDYKNTVATYVNSSSGKYLDFNGFLRAAQYSISAAKGAKTSGITDVATGVTVDSKSLELSQDLRVRVFMATDIGISAGRTSDGGYKAPHVRGNSLVGGHLEYTSGKWSFTADGGQSYELLNPSMYSPRFKQLPSGEFVMLATQYQGDGYKVFARMKQENYLNTSNAGLTAGVSTDNGNSLTATLSQNRIDTPLSTSLEQSARLEAATKIGDDTTITAGVGSTLSTDSAPLRTLDIGVQRDLISLLSGESSSPKEWQDFCKTYGIQTIPSDFAAPDWLQSLSARIYIANRGKLVDNVKIQEHFASLGLTVSGGAIHIKPDSTLYNSSSFRASLGMDTANGFGLTGGASYTHALESGRSATASASLDYVSAFGRLELTKNIAREDGSVFTLSGSGYAGVLGGRADLGGGVAVGTIGSDGRGNRYGVGLSNHGLSIEFGTQSLVFGDTTQRTRFSLLGINNSQSQNPGKTVSENGNTIGQYGLFYQFLSKSPADKATIAEITALLGDIGKDRTLTVSEDFARELRPRADLLRFREYLSSNKAILKDARVKSLHFDSMTDWLGMFRGTQGTELSSAGHLLIRSLDDKLLTADILKTTPPKKLPSEAKSLETTLAEYTVKIDTDKGLDTQQIESIVSLFEVAIRQGYGDRMKNITIRLSEDGENMSSAPMKWDEKNRILSMSLSALQFVLPSEKLQFSNIVGDSQKSLQSFLDHNKIKNLNDIVVIKKNDENDKRFKTTEGERSFSGVRNSGGKTYVYEDLLSEMMRLFESSKNKDGLGFLDQKKLDAYVTEWKNASIHTLNQFDGYLTGQMSDLKKSTAKVESSGGGGLLQGLIPNNNGQIEVLENSKKISFVQETVTTKEKIGDITVTMGTGENKKVTINIKPTTGVSKEYIVDPATKQNALGEMKKDHPELYRVIVAGSVGTNITTGKTDTIVSVLEKMFFTQDKK